MTRGSKSKLKRMGRLNPGRTKGIREPKQRILIVCEGEMTEPNYFGALKLESEIARRIVVRVVKGTGGSATETVNRAIQKKSDASKSNYISYDEIWCVLDVEGEDAGHLSSLRSAIVKAEKQKFKVVLSNPCFEVWYLAHFEKSSERFTTNQDVERKLSRLWQDAFSETYSKSAPNHYERLKDQTTDAIENARSVWEEHIKNGSDMTRHNSSTEVYKLVLRLLG